MIFENQNFGDDVILEMTISYKCCKILINFLNCFQSFSPFVSIQPSKNHLLISAINQSMTLFAILKLECSFFSAYRFNDVIVDDVGIKLDTEIFSNSLKCEAIIDTNFLLTDQLVKIHRRLYEDLNLRIQLNYEPIEFIQPIIREDYENFIVGLGTIWTNALSSHSINNRGNDNQIYISFGNGGIKLKTSFNDCIIENEIEKSIFHTWTVKNLQEEYRVIAPLDELIEIVQLADRQKALLQWRFGHNPLIIELISIGGCLARFVISCIDTDVNYTILNKRKKKQIRQKDKFNNKENMMFNDPYDDYQVTQEFEEMLMEDENVKF